MITMVLLGATLSFADTPSQHAYKAVYLKSFAQFTQGFNVTDKNLKIGLLVDPLVADEYKVIEQQPSKYGVIQLVFIKDIAELQGCCNLVFIDNSHKDVEIPSSLPKQVLVVTDYQGERSDKFPIQFVRLGNRLKFRVNLEATKRAGLKFESPLLNVALQTN